MELLTELNKKEHNCYGYPSQHDSGYAGRTINCLTGRCE